MLSLQKLTINNYINSNCNLSTTTTTIPNVLFLKQLNNNTLISIITKPENYVYIKKILLQILSNVNKNVYDAFLDLEILGFNSFGPFKNLNKTLQNLLNTKYKFLFEDKYRCKYFKICSNISSPIFTKSPDTILHTGTLKFLQLINDDMFVPYTIFMKEPYNNLTIYNTNTCLKNILIASEDNKTILSNTQIKLLCNLSITIIKSIGEFLNIDTKNQNIDLFLYMSSAKKICPNVKYEPISREHVNSGSTVYYHDSSYADPLVKIYRTEELIKVLFHELVHACKFDQIFDDYPKHTFKVARTQLLFTESITECFARIMNIILYSHIYGKNMNEILNDEIQFGIIQTGKILSHHGFTSVKDFLDINDTPNKIIQETSVFEYYILTTILLIKIDDYLSIIKNKGTIKDIVKLVNSTFNDDEYQKKVNYVIDNINNIDSVIMNTCKMTIIKIDLPNVVNYNKYKQKYLTCKGLKKMKN